MIPCSKRPVHYVVWRSLPGGMENYIAHYASHFKGEREVFIFSLRPGRNGLTASDEQHFTQGSADNWTLFGAYFRYCRKHRNGQFHLVNAGPMILLLTVLAGVKEPLYHIHGTKYWKSWRDRYFMRAAWYLTLPFRIAYVANSHHSATIFKRDAAPRMPRVVYNGFNVELFLANRHLRTGLHRMAYVGRLDRGKNADIAIRLFGEIAGERPDLELHFAGIGDLEPEIRDLALMSPFRRRIFFHGWIKDIAAFYRSMDLLVFPSSYESFGNVLAEGLLTGVPVLTSDIQVFEEIHGDPGTFCIGHPDNYPEMRDRFLVAVSHHASLAEKAFRASDRVAATFNMRDHLEQIAQTYGNT